MRDKTMPPPHLFISSDPSVSPAARRVHAICNSATWRLAKPGRRVRFFVLAVLWPLIASGIAIRWLQRNGAEIRAMTGKSTARQFIEMLHLAVRHRVTPKYYSMFEFYLDERRAKAGDYL